MESRMTTAFIGLGNMGLPMALNLAKKFDVIGFDLSEKALSAAAAQGIRCSTSVASAVNGASTVITMLPDGESVKSALDEIVQTVEQKTLIIDCSTIDIATAREVHDDLSKRGLQMVDAPVSGGTAGAAAATLTFMCGGETSAIERARPLLEAMGKRIVPCGPAGAGQAAKMCNNMILGVSMIAVCEAFTLADKIGLDRQAVFDVVSTSSGSCWSMNTYCPVPGVGPKSPADNDYEPGFASALMLKDLTLSQDAAQAANAATPLGAHAQSLYKSFVEQGHGAEDFSAIIRALAAMKRERAA
jgi:3-hydroxyisobutyrate dehydrogenase